MNTMLHILLIGAAILPLFGMRKVGAFLIDRQRQGRPAWKHLLGLTLATLGLWAGIWLWG